MKNVFGNNRIKIHPRHVSNEPINMHGFALRIGK